MITYMGDLSDAQYDFPEKQMPIDNVSAYEMSYYNIAPEKYKGAELICRVNVDDFCPLDLLHKTDKAIEYVEQKYKEALKDRNIENEFSEMFIRSGISMCMDITPHWKDEKPTIDISLKYINFNPWTRENLSENRVFNGIPKTISLSGGFIESPKKEFHIGYFPKCEFTIDNLDTTDFRKSFVKSFDKAFRKFRTAAENDFIERGDTKLVPENMEDGNISMYLIVDVVSTMGRFINREYTEELEKKIKNLTPEKNEHIQVNKSRT